MGYKDISLLCGVYVITFLRKCMFLQYINIKTTGVCNGATNAFRKLLYSVAVRLTNLFEEALHDCRIGSCDPWIVLDLLHPAQPHARVSFSVRLMETV
jgi:hypothetical protein